MTSNRHHMRVFGPWGVGSEFEHAHPCRTADMWVKSACCCNLELPQPIGPQHYEQVHVVEKVAWTASFVMLTGWHVNKILGQESLKECV